jgi:hypothetical protein
MSKLSATRCMHRRTPRARHDSLMPATAHLYSTQRKPLDLQQSACEPVVVQVRRTRRWWQLLQEHEEQEHRANLHARSTTCRACRACTATIDVPIQLRGLKELVMRPKARTGPPRTYSRLFAVFACGVVRKHIFASSTSDANQARCPNIDKGA